MDLETDALLFSKPTSRHRKQFKATLFSEYSLKQHREVQIYGLLCHRIWIGLEGDPEVVDYNEKPLGVSIPQGTSVFKHRFRFAVRRKSGTVLTIDLDEGGAETDEARASEFDQGLIKQQAIQCWCEAQQIDYRRVSRAELAGDELRLSNLRTMLKFIESVHEARDVVLEEQVNLIVANLAPVPIRQVVRALPLADETIVLAQVARSVLSGRFKAPIEKRNFDGALVIDLAEG